MPKISVIVPVYKAEEYLRHCVDSILAQTFSDFEILLVDDGSPDGSGAICDAYAAQYENIRAMHQENRGQAAARNHALTQARGDWLCYVDSDDGIHPQMLELLYTAAIQSGAPISFCGMAEGEQPPEDFLSHRELSFAVLSMEEASLTRLYDRGEYPGWVACAKLIRQDIAQGYPFREGRVYEDNEAVCRWICQAGSLAKLPYDLYFYRKNPQSTTQASFSMKKLDYLWALESIIAHYSSLGYFQMRQRFADRYVDAVVSCCNDVQYTLGRRKDAETIEKNCYAFLHRQGLKLRREQRELLLDTMHPRLSRIYWPAAGVVRTLRSQGLSGILRKIRGQFRKDEQT